MVCSMTNVSILQKPLQQAQPSRHNQLCTRSGICRPIRALSGHSHIPDTADYMHVLSSPLAAPRPQAAAAAAPPAAAAGAAAPTAEDSLRSCAVALAKVADDTKALDISVLHVEPLVSWTSYMVLCTVMSKPQLLAVLSRMEDAAAEFDLVKQNSAGSSQWELLDFGSIVVHVFTAEQREHYALDDFYGAADEVELPFAVTPSYSMSGAAGSGSGGFEEAQWVEQDVAAGSGAALWSKSL